MNLLDPLIDLLIFAKENGGDEQPEVRAAISAVERKVDGLRQKRRRQDARRNLHRCEICEMRAESLLCWACLEKAPAKVRHAFRDAAGLDGMRRAVATIKTYAAGQRGSGSRRAA